MLARKLVVSLDVETIEELETICNTEELHSDLREATENLISFLGEEALPDIRRLAEKHRGTFVDYVLDDVVDVYCEANNLCKECFAETEEKFYLEYHPYGNTVATEAFCEETCPNGCE